MIYGIGSFIGPTLAGFSLAYLGVAALTIYYVSILVVFSILLSIQLIRSRIIEKPEDHESQYVAMVRTSQNVLPLHPESEEVLDVPEERRDERKTSRT
jgi:phosphoglycerol transferase MdoB-like AlkP superfamily enzyme